MQRLVLLVILASLLAGCFSPGGPSNTMPTTPDEYFTGEPTTLIVRFGSQTVQSWSPLFTAVAHANDSAIAYVRIGRVPEISVGFYQIPRDSLEPLVVQVPAERNYRIEAFTYNPVTGELLEVGAKQTDVAAKTVNEVEVPLATTLYTFEPPPELYSHGMFYLPLDVIDRDALNGRVLIARNPWEAEGENGVEAMHRANSESGDSWILNDGVGSRVPAVDEDTTLYYQIEVCTKPRMTRDGTTFCVYEPDITKGQSLYTITVKPHDPDLPTWP